MTNNPLFRTKDVWAKSGAGGPGIPYEITKTSTYTTNSIILAYRPNMKVARMNAYTIEAARILTYEANTPDFIYAIATGCNVDPVTGTKRRWICVEYHGENDGGQIFRLSDDSNDPWVLKLEGASYHIDDQGSRVFTHLEQIAGGIEGTAPFALTPIYVAMMLLGPREREEEFKEIIKPLMTAIKTPAPENADKAFELCATVDAVFNHTDSFDVSWRINIPGGSIPLLDAENIVINPNSVLSGTFQSIRTSGAVKVADDATTFGEAKKIFAAYATTQKWDDQAEELIPTFPDDYPVLPEAVKIAKRYVKTRDAKRPMNNFLWRGITSYGKSTGVELIAALLHVPLVRMTCSSDMETQDFLSEYVPSNDPPVEAQDIPTVEQMLYDPDGSWEQITGEERDGVTADECVAELMRRSGQSGDAPRFKHIESNFVRALANGWICEVQEISAIRDPGVLKGLNEYDRPGAIVPLANGDTVRRHHDAMVIFTDNVGYAASRPIDQSVIRRSAFALDSYEMSEATVRARVKYNTGFDDDVLLDAMYITWRKIQDYCKEHDITEGSVSVTELEMWVMCVMLEDNAHGVAYDTCRECVVAKATSRQDEQEEIMSACVDAALYNV